MGSSFEGTAEKKRGGKDSTKAGSRNARRNTRRNLKTTIAPLTDYFIQRLGLSIGHFRTLELKFKRNRTIVRGIVSRAESVGKLGGDRGSYEDAFNGDVEEREREREEGRKDRGNKENKRRSLWAKGPVVVFPSEVEEEDERGRFSWLGPRNKKGDGWRSRFVGNSFLLFEPVFSLARRLYISALLPFAYARTNIRGARNRDP